MERRRHLKDAEPQPPTSTRMRTRLTTAEVDSLIAEQFAHPDRPTFESDLGALFVTIVSRYDLGHYDGTKLVELQTMLEKVHRVLSIFGSSGYDAVKASLMDGCMPDDVLKTCSGLESALLHQFVTLWIRNQRRPLEEHVMDDMYALWREQCKKGLIRVSLWRVYNDSRNWKELTNRIEFLKTLFKQNPIRDSFVDLLTEIRERDQLYPCGLICGPSGSGKSTFIQSLCCEAIMSPTLYTLFCPSTDGSTCQKHYRPFLELSKLFLTAEIEDVLMLLHDDPQLATDFSKSMSEIRPVCLATARSNAKIKDDPSRPLAFRTVGLIVAVFKKLVELKTSNPEATWLELQCRVDNLQVDLMTISAGIEALEMIHSHKETLPLLMIVDECCLPKECSALKYIFEFLRSVYRCLGIVVVFTVIDTVATTFTMEEISLGLGLERPTFQEMWGFIFNIVPPYDDGVLAQKVESLYARFQDCPRMLEIVKFVKNVATIEQPWFIEMFLERLGAVESVEAAESSPLELLNSINKHCLIEFVTRKIMVSRRDEYLISFAKAQMSYTCNFSCYTLSLDNGQTITVRNPCHANEMYINRHVGHLAVYPDKPGGPYVTLARCYDDTAHFKDPNCPFESMSVFASFYDAPITGLVLFGLHSDHPSFFENPQLFPVSVLNTFLWRFDNRITGVRNSGTNLELLFNSCAIVASRANGLSGCGVVQYLRALIQELSTIPKTRPIVLVCAVPFPWDLNDGAVPRRIPVLSPMSMSSWNPQLVSVLRAVDPDACLGMYRSSKDSDRCDGVAYYHDPLDQVLVPATREEMMSALKFAKGSFPVPFNPPTARGQIMKIRRYPRRIAFAAECKQLGEKVGTEKIKSFVKGKFLEQTEFDSCDLFFLLAYHFKAFEKEFYKNGDPKLALDGVAFWYLKRLEDQNGFGNRFELAMLPLPTSRSQEVKRRHVILLSLETIWGEDFSEIRNKFRRIREE